MPRARPVRVSEIWGAAPVSSVVMPAVVYLAHERFICKQGEGWHAVRK